MRNGRGIKYNQPGDGEGERRNLNFGPGSDVRLRKVIGRHIEAYKPASTVGGGSRSGSSNREKRKKDEIRWE